jgi:hypothetical protein
MEKEIKTIVLEKDKKEDKFSRLSLALKNNLLRRKSKNKLVANQKTQDN